MSTTPQTLVGDNSLHIALKKRPVPQPEELEKILSSSCGSHEQQLALVNGKTVDGWTPLMLCCQQSGDRATTRALVAAARFLLQRGAEQEVLAKAQIKWTAAQYAEATGKPRLAADLRELEAAQLAGAATQGDKERHVVRLQGKNTRDSHCALCGDKLRESRFLVVEAQVANGEETNPLITKFFSTVSTCTLAKLNMPVLHAFNQRRKFTRELTEALAMLEELERVVSASRECQPFHVIDLCCGKGFLATLCAVLYPDFTVTAVDRIATPFLPHFAEAGIHNCQYVSLDVLAPSFPSDVAALIQANSGKPTIVLGMHLCGLLSISAINLVREVAGVHALVLAPCCLPNQLPEKRGATPATVYEAKGQAAKYERWCDFLEATMADATQYRALLGTLTDGKPELIEMCGECSPEAHFECTRREEPGTVSQKRTLLACCACLAGAA